jgi:ketosteroid isomerase-like protein
VDDTEAAMARALVAYASAVHAKDIDALMQLYDADVRVFDAWGVWSYDGAAAWKGAIEAWFAGLGEEERVKVTFEEVRAAGSRECATVSAIVTYAGISISGEPLRAMQNRLTWVVRATDDGVRILHEHTSAPIGFDDSKAMLERR